MGERGAGRWEWGDPRGPAWHAGHRSVPLGRRQPAPARLWRACGGGLAMASGADSTEEEVVCHPPSPFAPLALRRIIPIFPLPFAQPTIGLLASPWRCPITPFLPPGPLAMLLAIVGEIPTHPAAWAPRPAEIGRMDKLVVRKRNTTTLANPFANAFAKPFAKTMTLAKALALAFAMALAQALASPLAVPLARAARVSRGHCLHGSHHGGGVRSRRSSRARCARAGRRCRPRGLHGSSSCQWARNFQRAGFQAQLPPQLGF